MGASHDGAEAGLGEARTGQHLLDRNKRPGKSYLCGHIAGHAVEIRGLGRGTPLAYVPADGGFSLVYGGGDHNGSFPRMISRTM
jgi:hypothetical protein